MAEKFSFPQDLRDAQVQLHQARADLSSLLAGLPWSVEPMTGWTTDPEHTRGYRSERSDSPGWTQEEQDAVAALRARVLELSVTVSTHPFWATVDRGDVVAARMALKHAHEEPAAETT
ncbi:hypothetical protein ACSNOH_00950 [Streptomyces sp. URMC 127]|uniref:hypothetical protein n=1 Tax=Streptomyces sp. URMC 127 TaxID=3423402 RepID=UPI003F1BF4B9